MTYFKRGKLYQLVATNPIALVPPDKSRHLFSNISKCYIGPAGEKNNVIMPGEYMLYLGEENLKEKTRLFLVGEKTGWVLFSEKQEQPDLDHVRVYCKQDWFRLIQ